VYIEPRDAFHLSPAATEWQPAMLSRGLDIVIAVLALAFFLPLLVLIAVAIAYVRPGVRSRSCP